MSQGFTSEQFTVTPESGLRLLGEHVLTSDATYVEVSSLPATYKDLHIVAELKSDRTTDITEAAHLQVGNGTVDTGASDYAQQYKYWGDSSPAPSQDASNSYIYAGIVPGEPTTPEADVFGVIVATIAGYANTDHYRNVIGKTAMYAPDAGSNVGYHTDFNGVYKNTTDAIDVIRLSPEVGTNWLAESSLRVYGWGADSGTSGGSGSTAGDPYATLPGLKPPDTADTDDEEWLTDTTTPSGWSWGNQGTAVIDAGKRRLILTVPSSSSYSLRAIGHAAPSGDFDVTVPVWPNHTGEQYQTTGIGLLWGTMASPTRVETIRYSDNLSRLWQIATDRLSNLTTYTSTHTTKYTREPRFPIWFKLAWDDTAEELDLSYSVDSAAETYIDVTTALAGPGTSPDFVILFGSDRSSDLRTSVFGPVRFNWTPDYAPT